MLRLSGLGVTRKGLCSPPRISGPLHTEGPSNFGRRCKQLPGLSSSGPPTGELQRDQPTSGALRFRSLPLPDSPGAEDQRRQERQQVVSGAEFHAAAGRGPSSLAGLALAPFPGSCLSFGPRPPRSPLPQQTERDPRTDASRRRARKAGSRSLRVMSPAASPALPGSVRAAPAPAPPPPPPLRSPEDALSLALEAARQEEEEVPGDGPARSGPRAALTPLHTPARGADHVSLLSRKMGRRRDGAG